MHSRGAIAVRAVQGVLYAGTGGLFLLSVQAYLATDEAACAVNTPCPPSYVWPLLGMAILGALADTVRQCWH